MKVNNNLINTGASLRAANEYNRVSSQTGLEKRKIAAGDKIELSEEAKAALNNESNVTSAKPYDLKRILELHYKKNRTMEEAKEESAARRLDPELDAQLYAADKAEALDFVAKVQQILMKAMSGKELTPEEKEMVNGDPLLSAIVK